MVGHELQRDAQHSEVQPAVTKLTQLFCVVDCVCLGAAQTFWPAAKWPGPQADAVTMVDNTTWLHHCRMYRNKVCMAPAVVWLPNMCVSPNW